MTSMTPFPAGLRLLLPLFPKRCQVGVPEAGVERGTTSRDAGNWGGGDIGKTEEPLVCSFDTCVSVL